MIKTDLNILTEILRGERKEITCVYGEPATGKTTLVKEAAVYQVKKGNKVVFIDSENSFSAERVIQLGGNDKNVLNNIFVLKPKDLKKQGEYLNNIKNLKEIGLVIIDSIGIFHRYELKKDAKEANRELDRQFNFLSELCLKKTGVMLTNQVYKDINKNKINLVGGDMTRNWSRCLLRLEKEPRRLILEKPEKKEVEFKIVNEGLL